mmetsp:Transcript_18411/g.39823  ORF Transcript_18411/g.39823 Transcript_18411/m.39823 type:complete len:84 (-) Transcript_18411:403-654(-)
MIFLYQRKMISFPPPILFYLIFVSDHTNGAGSLFRGGILWLVVGISTKKCIPGYEFGGIFAEIVFGFLFSSRKLTYIVSPDES